MVFSAENTRHVSAILNVKETSIDPAPTSTKSISIIARGGVGNKEKREKSPRNFIQRTRSIDEMLELFVDFEMNQRYFVFVVVHDDVSEPGKNFQRTLVSGGQR